jgi:superfamily II DNA or RNA helicase
MIETGKITPRDYQWSAYNQIANHIRNYTGPAIVEAATGAGKSLIIAMIAKRCQDAGLPMLMIARQGELVRQNANEMWEISVKNSVFSASLNSKSTTFPIIAGSEGTICRALDNELRDIRPAIIAIDEAHQLPWEDCLKEDPETQYGKIIKEMISRNPSVRIIGLTGSPFRGVETIMGDFWKKKLLSVDTAYLTNRGYLKPIVFGFGHDDAQYDLSEFKTDGGEGMRDFTSKELQAMQRKILKEGTTTNKIMLEVQNVMAERGGVSIITCAGRRHCEEAARFLQDGTYGIITDSTSTKKRVEMLDAARDEKIQYLLQVGCLTTGLNVPSVNTIVILRNIGSLTLLVQLIGRGLRPYFKDTELGAQYYATEPQEDEKRKQLLSVSSAPDCLVLDYSGTLHELGELYQNPILEAAELQKARINNDYITCPDCGTKNSQYARRCIGDSASATDGRCEYFWQSIQCPSCETHNDIAARECRTCDMQLIDPNKNLSGTHYTEGDYKPVLKFSMRLTKNQEGVIIDYVLPDNEKAMEIYYPQSDSKIAKRMWNQKFVKAHIKGAGWQQDARRMTATQVVKLAARFDVPTHITHRINDKGKSIIHKKLFRSGREDVANKQ